MWYIICRYALQKMPTRYFNTLLRFIHSGRLGLPFYFFKTPPTSFNEVLCHLKINYLTIDHGKYADKILVRDYVKETVGENYLVPQIDILRHSELKWDKYPDQFIIKVNHGSGFNIIIKEKNSSNKSEIESKLKKWLSIKPYYLSREPQYKNITPGIIIEKYLGDNVYDYKFFCANGKVKAIVVDVDRFGNHSRVMFDPSWNILDVNIRYKSTQHEIQYPKNLKEMIKVSEQLSQELKFCRVDLYNIDGQIFFGELTLCPGGGVEPFRRVEQDYKFGKLVFENEHI